MTARAGCLSRYPIIFLCLSASAFQPRQAPCLPHRRVTAQAGVQVADVKGGRQCDLDARQQVPPLLATYRGTDGRYATVVEDASSGTP